MRETHRLTMHHHISTDPEMEITNPLLLVYSLQFNP